MPKKKKVPTVRIDMTDSQMEEMKPLFDRLKDYNGEGMIIGQVWERGFIIVGVVHPRDVLEGMKKTVAKLDKKNPDFHEEDSDHAPG